MYALKFVKDGVAFWCLYIGSATNFYAGASARIKQYEDATVKKLPQYVQKALNYGFSLANIGALAWCPRPDFDKRLDVRAAFLALEATFSILFWALHNSVDNTLGFSPSTSSTITQGSLL